MTRRAARPDPSPANLTTGERLSLLMKEQGTSLASLATSLRIQQSTLDNFRAGYRNIPSDVVVGMARELGTNADYLLERSDDPRPAAAIAEETRLRLEARRSS